MPTTMLGLIDTNGNYYEAEHNITGATEVPPRPSQYHTWVNDSWELTDTSGQLSHARTRKLNDITKDRDAECVANVSVHDRQWQSDQKSQALLGQAITLATAGLPLPSVWRDADNNDMAITSLSDLLLIAGEIATQTEAAYARSWDRKLQLQNAATIEAIEAV